MDEVPRDDPIDIKIMNDYSVDLPLWFDEGQHDPDELPISGDLRHDLEAFAARWEANVDQDVFDDRFDRLPPVRFVVDTWRAVRWRLSPGRREEADAEDAAMRALGESLRDRLQAELGERYRVRYHH